MKRTIFLLFLLTFILACNNDPEEIKGDPPEKVARSFFEKMSQKDFDGAATFATKDSKPALDMLRQFVATATAMNPGKVAANDPAERFKSIEISKATISGNTAIVSMKYPGDSIEVEFPLKVEEGRWKAEFSIATITRIGMTQMGKRGISTDSVTGKMNHLKEQLLKRRFAADSLVKIIDPEKLKQTKTEIENQ
jgi:hypothetical protein